MGLVPTAVLKLLILFYLTTILYDVSTTTISILWMRLKKRV